MTMASVTVRSSGASSMAPLSVVLIHWRLASAALSSQLVKFQMSSRWQVSLVATSSEASPR